MASLGHIAVGMAAGRLAGNLPSDDGRRRSLVGWMGAMSLLSLAPDADVIAFALRVPYEAPYGHRGAAHSLLVAAVVGLGAALLGRRLDLRPAALGALCATVLASHGLLDTLTDGGLGIALLWPVSDARMLSPVRPLEAAPLGLRMLSGRGLRILLSEALWFSPLLAYALWPRSSHRVAVQNRRRKMRRDAPDTP